MNIDIDQPIILGLSGQAATGKTSVAEYIVPKAQINSTTSNITWDHIFLALPLYEMASIKTNIKGLRERERQLYSLHEVIYDLYGGSPIGNIPDYDELISLTKSIYNLPIEADGIKPRSFLQKTGDLCRDIDEDCFARWAISKSHKLFKNYLKDDALFSNSNPFCVIISDVRFVNEAEWILKQRNGLVICFEASDEVRNQRLMKRDGRQMTKEQSEHKSEQQIHLIKQMANKVIDTNNLSIEQQSHAVISYIQELIGIYA